jgi:hypothetical protein
VRWDGSRLVGAAAAALGLATVALAAGLREGTATGGPGTRFLPALLGGLMVLLGGAVALGRHPAPPDRAGPDGVTGAGLARALATLGATGAYVLVLERLGFLLATAALLALLVAVYGERRWAVILGVAVAATGATYALFAGWLKVLLPPGLLGP